MVGREEKQEESLDVLRGTTAQVPSSGRSVPLGLLAVLPVPARPPRSVGGIGAKSAGT